MRNIIKFVFIPLSVLLVVIITFLPFVVRWQSVAWLERQGLEASIGYVSIRPVLGSVQVNDVSVRAPNGEQLSLGELHLKVAWGPLTDQWLQVEDLLLDSLTVDLVMGPDLMRVGGISLAAGGDKAEDGGDGGGGLKRFSIEQLNINNLNACYTRVDGDGRALADQCVHLGALTQLGEMNLGLGETSAFLLPGLNLQRIHWSDRLRPLALAQVGTVSVGQVASPDMTNWHMDNLNIAELSLLPDTDRSLKLDKLQLHGLSVAGDTSIEQLDLGEMAVNLSSTESGTLGFAPAMMARVEELVSSPEPAASPKVEDKTGNSSAFSLQQFALARLDIRADRPLLHLTDLSLQTLNTKEGNVSLQHVQLDDLSVLPAGEGDALQLDHLALRGLESGDNIAIQSLSLGDSRVRLETGPDGALAFAPELLAQLGAGKEGQKKEANDENAPATTVSLGALTTGTLSVIADRELLSLDALQLQQLHLAGGEVGLGSLRVTSLALLAPAEPMEGVAHYLSTPQITLSGLSSRPSLLQLDRLQIADPSLFLHRGPDGNLLMFQALQQYSGAREAADTKNNAPQKADAAPLKVSLGEVLIGENGEIRILDESVSPSLSQQFSEFDLALRHLDANRPAEGAAIDFSLGVNRFGYLKLTGNVAPYGKALNAGVEGDVNGLDVRDISGYAGKYIGYHLDQGTVDADIDFKVKEGEIEALVTTRFNKLQVSPLKDDEVPEGVEKLGVPLGFALSLLRDNDGMIELKLPISGNVDSPEFSLAKVINKVLFKVISKTVVNYYLPYGLLAKSLVSDGLANLADLAFQPVAFAPGSAALDDAGRQNLDRLAEMLQSRQQLHLVFCAPSTLPDWRATYAPEAKGDENGEKAVSDDSAAAGEDTEPAVTPEQVAAMKALADQRTETAKEYLVDAGVEPGQVILCTGDFEQSRDQAPEMAISIGQ